MIEQAFDQILAVVEIALQRQRMHVGGLRCGHLPLLHRRHTAFREQNENIGPVASGECIDRGPAGVAGRGADNRRPLAALGQYMVHQPCDELHRHILEGQRRAVEQLQDE